MSIQHVAAVLDARDERLTGSRKLVLVTLANRTNEHGRCWPSQQLLADECGISIRAIADHLKGLESDGFVVRSTQHLGKGNGSRTTYTLHLAKLKVAPADIAGAELAPATFVGCTGSSPHVTNQQEPTVDTIANAIVGHPPEIADPKKRSGKVRGAARASQLPASWQPDPTSYAYGSKQGLTPQEINHEADQFRNHAAQNRRTLIDWHAGFRTWLGKAGQWKRERTASKASGQNAGSKPRGGGLVAAGLRAVGEARGYGEPVSGERGMGAGHVIDGDEFRFTGS